MEKPIIDQFQEAIEKVVAQFCGMDLTTGEAVGVLEMAKLKIIRDSMDSEER